MDILIAVASRHHATTEIGERIGAMLRTHGLHVDIVEAEPTRWLDDEHDGYVIGSAVYMDRWLRSARRFVRTNETILARHPVWFFSSGPLGLDEHEHEHNHDQHDRDEHQHDEHGRPVETATSLVPIEHRVFPGRLDPHDLGPVERVVARAVGAATGDFRNWDDIDEWAEQIATTLLTPHPADTPAVTDASGPS